MNNVTKLMAVVCLAAAPVLAKGAWQDNVKKYTISLPTTMQNGDWKDRGIGAGVIAGTVAVAGGAYYCLDRFVPGFNKHVTKNIKAGAEGYVARMRKVDVPTWALTAAVLGLVYTGVKIHCKNNAIAAANDALTAANGRSVDANFERLAALELAGKKGLDRLEKAVTDVKAARDAELDATRKATLETDVTNAEKALADAKATHAGAYLNLRQLAAVPATKVNDFKTLNEAVDTAILDALKANNAIDLYTRA